MATKLVAFASKVGCVLALRGDGTVIGWGDNDFGQATPPAGLCNVIAVQSGSHHSLALVNNGAPVIVRNPWNQTAAYGADVVFTVGAAGNPALSYQWQRDGAAIPGATNYLLAIPNVKTPDAGGYRCVISNLLGSAVSAAAQLQVVGQPLEIDSRSVVLGSDSVTLRVLGLSGLGEVVIYASPDLTHWSPVLTNPPAAGMQTFTIPANPASAARFFRIEER